MPKRRRCIPVGVVLVTLWLAQSGCTKSASTGGDEAPKGSGTAFVAPVSAQSSEPTPPPSGSTASVERGIEWTLTAIPPRFEMRARDAFLIEIEAHNSGTSTMSTDRERIGLWVNGVSSRNFQLNWGNGMRDRRWKALPAGDKVTERRGLSSDLFPKAGKYELALMFRGQEVSKKTIEIVD